MAVAVAAGLGRPDWAVITAAMILHQGPDRILGSYRAAHRFVGTVLGLALLAGLSLFDVRGAALVLVCAAMMAGIEAYLVRNYGLAMVFITPLALILGALGTPADLVLVSRERLVETVIGVVVAFAVMGGVLPRAHRRILVANSEGVLAGDERLATHTLYRPRDLSPFGPNRRLPIVAWANGGCRNSSGEFRNFLSEIASHGFLVVAIGPAAYSAVMGSEAPTGTSQATQLIDGVDWAIAENERDGSPLKGRIATDRVFLTGHSMGGGTTLGIIGDFEQFGLVVDEWSRPPQLLAAVVHGTHKIPPPRTGDPIPVDCKVPLAFIHGAGDTIVTLDQSRRTFTVCASAS